MKIGLCFFPTDDSIHPAELATAAEERGIESIWLAEHSHIPVTDGTPGPGQPGLPREYYAVADPFVSLGFMAAATKKLLLGTGVCLVPQRDVFQLAKEVATIDFFSGGRFLFGVGGGWNAPEIQDHGTDPNVRFGVMRERIEAMKVLWTEERAEYHGKHVDFGPCFAWPKPAQKPGPPIHVGGTSIRRAVRYGDGWIPLAGVGDGDPVNRMSELREELEKAGRSADGFDVSIYFCPPEEEYIERCREAGIARGLFGMPSDSRDSALAALDGYAKLVS